MLCCRRLQLLPRVARGGGAGVNKVRSDQLFYRVNVLKSRDWVMFCGWMPLKICGSMFLPRQPLVA